MKINIKKLLPQIIRLVTGWQQSLESHWKNVYFSGIWKVLENRVVP